jgi:E3 ubiquitin-protein ligase HECTD1
MFVAEQCIKVLELMCSRETAAVFDAGGLASALQFVRMHSPQMHRDTLHSAMSVVTRLCGKMEPANEQLAECVRSLADLLIAGHDSRVTECALKVKRLRTRRTIVVLMCSVLPASPNVLCARMSIQHRCTRTCASVIIY